MSQNKNIDASLEKIYNCFGRAYLGSMEESRANASEFDWKQCVDSIQGNTTYQKVLQKIITKMSDADSGALLQYLRSKTSMLIQKQCSDFSRQDIIVLALAHAFTEQGKNVSQDADQKDTATFPDIAASMQRVVEKIAKSEKRELKRIKKIKKACFRYDFHLSAALIFTMASHLIPIRKYINFSFHAPVLKEEERDAVYDSGDEDEADLARRERYPKFAQLKTSAVQPGFLLRTGFTLMQGINDKCEIMQQFEGKLKGGGKLIESKPSLFSRLRLSGAKKCLNENKAELRGHRHSAGWRFVLNVARSFVGFVPAVLCSLVTKRKPHFWKKAKGAAFVSTVEGAMQANKTNKPGKS